eukprot:Skav235403  [mRNA]  locus=scaffold487:152535:155849:+ [translate_table: standard]
MALCSCPLVGDLRGCLGRLRLGLDLQQIWISRFFARQFSCTQRSAAFGGHGPLSPLSTHCGQRGLCIEIRHFQFIVLHDLTPRAAAARLRGGAAGRARQRPRQLQRHLTEPDHIVAMRPIGSFRSGKAGQLRTGASHQLPRKLCPVERHVAMARGQHGNHVTAEGLGLQRLQCHFQGAQHRS